jgi:hypothetical protein
MFKNVLLLAVLFLFSSLFTAAQTVHHSDAPHLACRALEIHNDPQLKVTVIVFHQADEAQRAELAQLLRDHSDETVEIQGSQGGWQQAQMVRMKSCFGRGLLIMPTSVPVSVSEHSQFLLRIPGAAAPTSQN